MNKFEDMLDELMDAYPELKKDASALKSKLSEQMPGDEMEMEMGEEESEAPMMPGEFKPIPKELQDEEEEEDESVSPPQNIMGSY